MSPLNSINFVTTGPTYLLPRRVPLTTAHTLAERTSGSNKPVRTQTALKTRRATPFATLPPSNSNNTAQSPRVPARPARPDPPSSSMQLSKDGDAAHAIPKDMLASDVKTTVAWIAAATVAAGVIAQTKGSEPALQFITAYIVEYSLSVDNLFVFLLIFNYFRVPRDSQSRVLNYGIAGAVVFRAVMIVAGEALTHRFKFVTLAFAALLLYSAFNILISNSDDEEEDISQSAIVKFASGLLPFSDQYDGKKFFTTSISGASVATPLMLVLLSVEMSDVVFALDSVPAVLGISDDALIIYLSNIFAIIGLRNLFFVLADTIEDLRFLPQALAIVLGFVGAKMIAGVAGYQVGILQSLGVVVGTLALGIGLSVCFPEEQTEEDSFLL